MILKGFFKGYKTIVFNVVMTLAMGISLWNPDAAGDLPDAAEVTGLINQAEAWITGVWAIGNTWLRAVTSTAIFKKD